MCIDGMVKSILKIQKKKKKVLDFKKRSTTLYSQTQETNRFQNVVTLKRLHDSKD